MTYETDEYIKVMEVCARSTSGKPFTKLDENKSRRLSMHQHSL